MPRQADTDDGPEITAEPLRYRAGDLIGEKYRLKALIAEGGMGAVWRAENEALGVEVAIKLVLREHASEETRERLQQEAHAAAKLEHPSVVRVFDFGETDAGDPFIAMEILRGETLRDVMEREGAMPPARVVELMLPVLSALAAAHARGIVHRDLKPENVVLVVDENEITTPKVVDFGIAKIRRAEPQRRSTQEGTVMGSPDYMSPEQARGQVARVDERTDVWAAAVVCYEALTGQVPFDGENYNSLLRAIIEDEPLPIPTIVQCDESLWQILQRGLAKDIETRCASMRAFGTALASWGLDRGVTTDITGASLARHWGGGSRPSLVEALPSRPPSPVVPAARSRAPKKRWVFVYVALGALLGSVGLWIALSASERATSDGAAVRDASSAQAASAPNAREDPAGPAGSPSTGAESTAGAASPPGPSAPGAPQPAVTATVATPSDAGVESTDMPACVREVFPKGTFSEVFDADFAYVCQERDPRRGAVSLHADVARAGLSRPTATEGMQQWALLSWYEMAVFAVARGACCDPEPEALSLPPPIGTCPPLGAALEALRKDVQTGTEDAELRLDELRESFACALRTDGTSDPQQRTYRYQSAPGGGAVTAFRGFLKRAIDLRRGAE